MGIVDLILYYYIIYKLDILFKDWSLWFIYYLWDVNIVSVEIKDYELFV